MSDQKMAELRSQNWTVILYDIPETGMRGFVASKEGEQEQRVSWPLFDGAPYSTNDATLTAEEVARFIEGGDVCKCDDPVQRLVGFVRYDHGTKTAFVRRCSLTSLRNATEKVRDAIMGVRDELSNETQGPS